ncbi:MAG: L,D-transpeptidase [Prosthecobacter sp.]|uniref:L,D-transpeptidase n=1 Tax=Prosthecobacter sp. TaxID=1965333 RepID=UPI002630D631|nr:L,D-transpeptidase [Prosthecobacter sp.]MCF7790283.1 L,D-transpeptidase [Prosthecobacter sp.]
MLRLRLPSLLILSLLPACTLLQRKPSPTAPPKPAYHIDTALAAALKPAAASIEIDLTRQEMRLLNADKAAVVVTQISSGRNTSPTPTGDFKVLEKLPTKFSNRYGKFVKPDTREVVVWRTWEHHGPPPQGTRYEGYEMPHWLRLTWPGVGIHQGEFRPGELSSKGCIRTPAEPQQVIWEHAQVGTPVHIRGSSAAHPDAP